MQGSRARSALVGSRFADLRWVTETQSTNDDLLRLAREGAPEGVVLVADHQRAGRGRLDRTWQAPAGSSLLISILLRPALAPADAHLASTAVACAAVEACTEVAAAEPRLKWPNDLVVVDGNRVVQGKLAGILAESIIDDDQLRAVVVGIGINVNWPPELPADLRGIATALNHVVGRHVDREDLLLAFVQRFNGWRDALDDVAGRGRLVDRYRQLCVTIGASVRVDLHDGSFTGEAVDISPEGHLLVEAEGVQREVMAGDVVHVRAT
jgi:BirA family biotin operon repressor/biotin-[acetyl-CoA-carboxylase] ligase